MASAGWEADELIINASRLQETWAGAGFPWTIVTPSAGADSTYRPDVLYLQDLSPATEAFITAVRPLST